MKYYSRVSHSFLDDQYLFTRIKNKKILINGKENFSFLKSTIHSDKSIVEKLFGK